MLLLLSFLFGMLYMWVMVAVICCTIDTIKGTNYVGTWCEAWNILPELKILKNKFDKLNFID